MTMNNFPQIGINTAELLAEVERLLELARASREDLAAINWGDLGVHDIEYRLSMLSPESVPRCVVRIEEVSPSCELAMWLYDRLDKERFPNTYFECEW